MAGLRAIARQAPQSKGTRLALASRFDQCIFQEGLHEPIRAALVTIHAQKAWDRIQKVSVMTIHASLA
jgi:hypothetical protein